MPFIYHCNSEMPLWQTSLCLGKKREIKKNLVDLPSPSVSAFAGEVSNWRPGNPVSSSLSMLGSGGYDPASLFQVGSPPPLPAICSRVHSSPAGKFSPLTFKTERLRKSFSVPQSSGRVPDTLVGVPSIDDERLGYVRGLGHPPRDRRLGSPSYGGFQLPSASPWQQQQRGEFPRQRLPVSALSQCPKHLGP